jgi:hypothetical protein
MREAMPIFLYNELDAEDVMGWFGDDAEKSGLLQRSG